jgi:hypothetical protein
VAAVPLLGALLTACGSSGGPVHVLDASRVKSYHTIAQLQADAAAVVEASPTGVRSVELVNSTPFTILNVSVTSTLRGHVEGSTIAVRQLGDATDPRVVVEDGTSLVVGHQYVLFLEPFYLTPGVLTGQYVVVGSGAGTYTVDNTGTLHRQDELSTDLPASLSLTALEGMLQ